MYKPILSILTGFLFLLPACNPKNNNDPFSATISKKKAREDFMLFRDILQQAHPSLTEYITEERKTFLFDSVYKTIDRSLTYRSFYNKLTFICDEIGCSHTYTSFPQIISDSIQNRKLFFPLPVILINDALYTNSDHTLVPGSKILSVNGLSTDKLLDSLSIYHTVDGNHRRTQAYMAADDFSIDYFAHFGGTEKFEILVKDTSGYVQTQHLDAITLEEWHQRNSNLSYYDATDVTFSLEFRPASGYALIRLPSFEFNSSSQQMAYENFLQNSFELLSAKPDVQNLVIDLRENTGGDLYNCFLFYSYLAKDSFYEYRDVASHITEVPYTEYVTAPYYDRVKHVNRKLDTSFVKSNSSVYNLAPKSIDLWKPSPYAYKGKVYIITNAKVVSAASYFALLSRQAGAKLVGIETAGGDYTGNGFTMLEYKLPYSQIRFGFPYAQIRYTYGKPKTGRGLIPDYLVPDTYQSFKNNSDQQLSYLTDSVFSKNE